MARIGIAGGTGYGGLELIHILLRHPQAEIAWISSQQHAGKKLQQVHPHLEGLLDVYLEPLEKLPFDSLDVLFLALPHGEATKLISKIPEGLVVIDLSGDFRLQDPKTFDQYYGFPMDPRHQKSFVYGLTELKRNEIRSARRISNPGCFATATILALHPLFQQNWIQGPVFVDSKTGSSGAGNSPLPTTHHPYRANSMFAYKPFCHQHLPEILQTLNTQPGRVVFQTYSAPFVRGIFASHYMQLNRTVQKEDVAELYQSHYRKDHFIRWVDRCPNVNSVRNSNFVDIGAAVQSEFLIVWSVLDNLQKGAAGQAVQNMNVMCGFPEQTALENAPALP